MTWFRVTGRQPDGTRFRSTPRTREEADELAKNLRAEASDRKAKTIAKKAGLPVVSREARGLQTDIRVEPARDAPIERVFVSSPPRAALSELAYLELMGDLERRGHATPEYIEAQVQRNKTATLAEREAAEAEAREWE